MLVDMQERGRLALSGAARKKLLHRVTTNDIDSLSPGEGDRKSVV